MKEGKRRPDPLRAKTLCQEGDVKWERGWPRLGPRWARRAIHCQLDDQIESPADFSHFDPICLALAPPTSPAPRRKSAAACARSSSSSKSARTRRRRGGALAALRSGGGRDFRRRRPRRSPLPPFPVVSHSIRPPPLPACQPCPSREDRRRRPARRAVTTSPRIFAVGIHSCSLSKTLPKVRRIFSTRAPRPARFDTALP